MFARSQSPRLCIARTPTSSPLGGAVAPLAISWGIARWLFNGLSYELPQVDAKVLPASPRYVAHFEWLVQQSKARTMQNRS